MTQQVQQINVFLLRGACLWILMALLLAWIIVGLYNQIGFLLALFPGSPTRVIQAHIDFLLMSALILGFAACRTMLPWHVKWAMVVGAFTNSSLFLMYAIFPVLDPVHVDYQPSTAGSARLFDIYLYSSLVVTSYGFGKASLLVLNNSFRSENSREEACKRCGKVILK